MTETPRIAMSPAELPAQRIHAVVELPPPPPGCAPQVWFLADFETNPFPKRRPARMCYLGSAEWSWSPLHGRIDAYHLHRGRTDWCLYIQDLDPNDPEHAWIQAASASRRGVDARTAAIHLMLAAWGAEASEYQLGRFHWLNQTGFLAVPEWMAIARAVWGNGG